MYNERVLYFLFILKYNRTHRTFTGKWKKQFILINTINGQITSFWLNVCVYSKINKHKFKSNKTHQLQNFNEYYCPNLKNNENFFQSIVYRLQYNLCPFVSEIEFSRVQIEWSFEINKNMLFCFLYFFVCLQNLFHLVMCG